MSPYRTATDATSTAAPPAELELYAGTMASEDVARVTLTHIGLIVGPAEVLDYLSAASLAFLAATLGLRWEREPEADESSPAPTM